MNRFKAMAVVGAVLVGMAGVGVVGVERVGAEPPRGGQVARATLTGVLAERVFIQDCRCYPWVIDKAGREWEVDVSAVMSEAQALNGQRVRATGRWMTYQRDGQTIRYLKVTRLDPA